jgi:hypothetical protein
MENCFVIMPIGDQTYGDIVITKDTLRQKYDDLIKEALIKARPELEVFRADDISMPGSITNEIFTRLMYSSFVVADITYPNPNVFYELGIRHAISGRTILIKDKAHSYNVFDISHLRYIEYENTTGGLKQLAESLKSTFSWYDNNPNRTDNQFFELAALVKYQYPRFIDVEAEEKKKMKSLLAVMGPILKNPKLLALTLDTTMNQEDKSKRIVEEMQSDPEIAGQIFTNMISSGFIDAFRK